MIRIILECDGKGCSHTLEVSDPAGRPRTLFQSVDEALKLKGWIGLLVNGRCRALCPGCGPTSPPLERLPKAAADRRGGFTLPELLVVLAIVSILLAVTIPIVMEAVRGNAVYAAAQNLQGAITAAREAAKRDDADKGLRIEPDGAWTIQRLGTKTIDGTKALAGGRAKPMDAGPGYSTGLVDISTDPPPAGFDKPPQFLMLEQRRVDDAGLAIDPPSWEWNVRVGDRITINDVGGDYFVVGPEYQGPADGNVERFVNYGPAGVGLLDRGDGQGARQYLYLVNGRDDDGDGYADPSFDGVDQNVNGIVDDVREWVEIETWSQPHANGVKAGKYTLFRRPIPGTGVQVDLGGAVLDLTGWGRPYPPRSRVPVDPWTGCVELIIQPDGRIRPASYTSSPAWQGLAAEWIHLWLAERSDVDEQPARGDLKDPWPPRFKGRARLLSIHGRTGRIVQTEMDPERPEAAFAAAEGRSN